MKKWSVFNRCWHWINAMIVLALIITAQFKDTDAAVEVMRLHLYIGFCLIAIWLLRLIYTIVGADKYNLDHAKKVVSEGFALLKAKGARLDHTEKYAVEKMGAKLSYLGLTLAIILIATSGLVMKYATIFGLSDYRHSFKEIHEIFATLVALFVVLHVGGVIKAECMNEPNIVSDMINGGKRND